MGDVTYRIWPLLSFAEIPAYLMEMEQKGLRFGGMRFFPLLAKFQKTETPSPYCWDYFASNRLTEIQEYLDICKASGWEIAWQFGRHKIFRAKEGEDPAPIQEERIFRRNRRIAALKGELFRGTVLLALLLFWLWLSRTLFYSDNFAIMPQCTQLLAATSFLFLISGALWNLWKGGKACTAGQKLGERVGQGAGGGTAPGMSAGCIRRKSLAKLLFYGLAGLEVVTLILSVFWEQSNGDVVKIGLLTVVISSFLWTNIYGHRIREQWNRVGYPEGKQMPGTYSKEAGKNRIWGSAVAIMMILLCGAGYFHWVNTQTATLFSRNIYCDEIYLEQKNDMISNAYYSVRNARDKEMVLEAVSLRPFATGHGNGTRPEQRELLPDIVETERLRQVLEKSDWDVIYPCGMFYLVICRDNEIWCVLKQELKGEKFTGRDAVAFLKETGFSTKKPGD